MEIRTPEDLQRLIDSETGEHTALEFKGAPAIENKDEIGKDVSAMANASGGVIIYGMAEIDNKPSHVDPINNKSREYLDQVIAVQVRPKLDVKIYPINVSGGIVYVVDVPQGETAHQAKVDCRYHRRRNFTTHWMEDYEIRDVMNRSKDPVISLLFDIKGTRRLIPYLFNEGKIIAKHIRCLIKFPGEYLWETRGEQIYINQVLYYQIDEKNEGKVLHAGLRLRLSEIILNDQISGEFPIIWEVHADNAEKKEGVISIPEIYDQRL